MPVKTVSPNIITPEFRLSYPQLLQPKRNDLNGKDEYSLVALFPPKTDLSTLKKECERVLIEKFGTDRTKWPKNLRTPFRDQADLERDGVMPPGTTKGAIWCRLRTNLRPGLVDASLAEIIEPSKVYGGAWARASVRAFAYDQKGNRGCSLALVNVQIIRDGDAFGAPRIAAEKEFSAVEGAGTESSDASDLFGRM